MYMAGRTTSIRLSKETRDRIANFGKAGESLETALIRVLEIAEECEKRRASK
jgi:predicted DNA-binding protein